MIFSIRFLQAAKEKLQILKQYRRSILLIIVVLAFVKEASIYSDTSRNAFMPESKSQPVVALSFDDGPHPGYSDKIVEILDRAGINATFFIVGEMVKKYPELLKKEFLSGNEIGNHTYTDTRITAIEGNKAEEEIEKTQALIKKITGRKSVLLRPPGGHYNGIIVDIARKLGYQIVLWDLNSNDIVALPAWDIYKNIVSQVKDEDIVVFHDGISSTLDALPSIITKLKSRGFQFVTISELEKIKKARFYADARH